MWQIKIGLLAISFLHVANADELFERRYDLPPNKHYLPICHSQAVSLDSGLIEKQHILQIHHHFWVQYEIQNSNNQHWFITCNLENGHITQIQDLTDFSQ